MANSAKEQTENIYVRLPSSVVMDLDHRCVSLRIKRPEGLRRAIDCWLKGNCGQSGPKDESQEKLSVILEANDPAIESLARHSIDVLYDRLSPRKDESKQSA